MEPAQPDRLERILRLERRTQKDSRFHFWVLVGLQLTTLAVVLAILMLRA